MKDMTINEILKYLPHRYPFLLIDKVLNMGMEEEKFITAIKNVTINEAFFAGHFPEQPIMPGVLILEAMAQAAAILAYKVNRTQPSDGVLYYFAGIDNARFRRVVVPGDVLLLEVKVIRQRRDIWKLGSTAHVDNELVCTAELLSASKSNEVE